MNKDDIIKMETEKIEPIKEVKTKPIKTFLSKKNNPEIAEK